jgi:hypothetical protein
MLVSPQFKPYAFEKNILVKMLNKFVKTFKIFDKIEESNKKTVGLFEGLSQSVELLLQE